MPGSDGCWQLVALPLHVPHVTIFSCYLVVNNLFTEFEQPLSIFFFKGVVITKLMFHNSCDERDLAIIKEPGLQGRHSGIRLLMCYGWMNKYIPSYFQIWHLWIDSWSSYLVRWSIMGLMVKPQNTFFLPNHFSWLRNSFVICFFNQRCPQASQRQCKSFRSLHASKIRDVLWYSPFFTKSGF